MHPVVRRRDATHYEPISWDDAFALIGETLRGLSSPDEAVFYTSGKASNEAAFIYQLFARAFGTNNLPDCSNMCHESTSVALAEDDRHRQGLGQPRGRPRGRADRDQRPEPRHQPPADAVRARDRQAERRARSSRSTRCSRPGCRSSRTRRRPAGVIGSAPACPTCTCRSGSTATSRSGRPSALLILEAEEAAGNDGSVLDRDFIERHTTGFEEWAARHQGPRLGGRGRARPA